MYAECSFTQRSASLNLCLWDDDGLLKKLSDLIGKAPSRNKVAIHVPTTPDVLRVQMAQSFSFSRK